MVLDQVRLRHLRMEGENSDGSVIDCWIEGYGFVNASLT